MLDDKINNLLNKNKKSKEELLNQYIESIEKFLHIKFKGTTTQEKNEFVEQYHKYLFAVMFDPNTK